MTVLTHQVEELTRAISQVINTEHQKARIEVMKMIDAGVAAEHSPTTILLTILDWCKGETK